MTTPASSYPGPVLARLHDRFLTILPTIEMHGRVYFRAVVCPDRRRDLIAEMVALAWKWFLRLAEQGRDATDFPTVLASYAAKAVNSGRCLCGQQKARDVMSPRAQQRLGFRVSSLPDGSSLKGNIFDEALQDNVQTPVPDQVSFRCDFPQWLTTRTERDRRIAADLMAGERTLDVAAKFGMSPARVSQLRRDFREDWIRFNEALPSATYPSAAAHEEAAWRS